MCTAVLLSVAVISYISHIFPPCPIQKICNAGYVVRSARTDSLLPEIRMTSETVDAFSSEELTTMNNYASSGSALFSFR